MRKKLLALLMCATMVLGTAVTASAYSADDVKNAETVVKQYDKFLEEYNETAAKEIKFATNYVDGTNSIIYNYGIVGTANGNGDYLEYAKLDKENKKVLTYVGTDVEELTATVDSATTANKQMILNASPTAGKFLVKATDALASHYYYAVVTNATAGMTLGANQVVLRTGAAVATPIVDSDKIATLSEYNPATLTGVASVPTTEAAAVAVFQDAYGVDVDGYIPLTTSTGIVKAYTTLTDNYYAMVSKSAALTDIAEALAKGTITKDAVAVDVKFFKLAPATTPNINLSATATEYGFKSLYYYSASRADETVKVAADWLSRTNLKKAAGVSVYILDKNIPTVTDYFQRLGSVYKVADVVDGKFTADYLVSGTYIFDVAAATDNAGQADADATKPAADNTASPKTGDVAPIAALAVVMMGAFGAMVVASKKRA